MLQLSSTEITGLPKVTWRVPRSLTRSGSRRVVCQNWFQGRLLHREPAVPLEAARMSSTRMIFDNTRAHRGARILATPPAEALEASARWYVENGYVKASFGSDDFEWTAAD